MACSISAEIHFHQQDEISVFVQTDVNGDEQRIAEIGLLAFYAVRMLCNFGINDTSDHLATILMNAPAAVLQLATGQVTGGFRLISYPGHGGRYSFLASLKLDESKANFDFKPKGFGFFGRGLGYYGPISTVGLLRHLASSRCDDALFLQGLGQAALLCGQFHMNRQLTPVGQNQFGIMAMTVGASNAVPEA